METLLTRRKFRGRCLLGEAAFSGDVATFEAVQNALWTRLRPEQVEISSFLLSRE